MGQEDYLKRQLDQLGRVLSKMLTGLLGSKDKTTPDNEIDQVNQELKAELGFTFDEFARLENEELIRILEIEKQFSNTHFEKLADLFLFIADNSDNIRGKQFYEKSLLLYKHLEETESTYSRDRYIKVERILKNLDE